MAGDRSKIDQADSDANFLDATRSSGVFELVGGGRRKTDVGMNSLETLNLGRRRNQELTRADSDLTIYIDSSKTWFEQDMSIRATADNKFNRRNLLISVVLLAVGAWSAYDGFIAFPKKLKIAEEYATLYDLDKSERTIKWQEITAEKGWKREVPKAPQDVQGDILFNYLLFGLCTILGLFFGFKFVRTRGSWLELENNQIRTSWGTSFDLNQIQRIDKIKWSKKGIAKVVYKDTQGLEKTFVIDDFKYERVSAGKILEAAEAGLKPEQILLTYATEKDV